MITATLHKLPLTANSSFVFKRWDCNYFDKPWHYHKEYELVLINKGRGIRFIGDSVSFFQENDLVLIGSDIPHLYKCNEEYYALSNNELKSQSTFIHFTKDFLGNHFFQVPEMTLVNRLLEKSSLALEIHDEAKRYTIEKMSDMCNFSPARRLVILLEILLVISESEGIKPLLSSGYSINNSGDTKRLNEVFNFILENYSERVYEKDMAAKLNMSVPSFSRYFKHHTRKTFSEYLTEVRIGNACRLLMEKDYNITEVCYLSGFENLSNFYRHFKRLIGVVPKEYRDRFSKAVVSVGRDT